jgi:hypothetical protein
MVATAQAETDLSKLSKLTPYDGKAAIEAIDSMGFEVIPRSELEEVRGEGWKENVVGVLSAIIISYNVGPLSVGKTLASIYNNTSSAFGGYGLSLATASMRALGWEIGRSMAISKGYPDPGAFYKSQNRDRIVVELIPTPVRFGYNLVKNY